MTNAFNSQNFMMNKNNHEQTKEGLNQYNMQNMMGLGMGSGYSGGLGGLGGGMGGGLGNLGSMSGMPIIKDNSVNI